MFIFIEAFEDEVPNGSSAQHARPVEKPIASLDSDPDIENAWAAEIERRHAETESGTVALLPGPETLARLSAEFRSPPPPSRRCRGGWAPRPTTASAGNGGG